jgi:hypothetical protein
MARSKAIHPSELTHEEVIENGREWGRKAILAGWIITMAGVVGYCFAMLRAPQETGLLQALFTQGFLGWLSAVLLLGGVATWLAGNFAFFKTVLEEPSETGEEDHL